MKELSIEEKARAYDKAIERANELNYVSDKDSLQRKTVEHIFPELAESEDEITRKELIDFVKSRLAGFPDCKRFTDWLEKQGKNNMGISEATKKKLEFNLNKALEKETPESWNEFLDKQGEQKPAWSEEDEKFFKTALWHISYSISKGKSTDFQCDTTEWFKSLKNRVQPKQEWSENDERIRKISIGLLEVLRYQGYATRESVDWLKSLRPQNTWKPSEEQIDALEDAIADAVSSIQKNMLNSLYNDLKKLREK